jgi:hypothetical protein
MRRFALLSSLLGLLCLAAPAQSLPVGPIAPETTIDEGPADGETVEGETEFAFSATRAGAPLGDATFLCSVDGAAPSQCWSPTLIDDLEAGPHIFSVQAVDPLTTLVDPEPASRSFFVVEPECEEVEAGEAGEEEGEESELEEEDEGRSCEGEARDGRLPPRECVLRSARGRLSLSGNVAQLKVRYTAYAPSQAWIAYRVGRGGAKLDEARRRLSRRGAIVLTERLSPKQGARLRAARRFTLELSVPEAPGYCRPYETRALAHRRATRARAVWAQSGSIFGDGP